MRLDVPTVRKVLRTVAAATMLPMLTANIACGPPRTVYPDALNSERPDERIAAIRHAAEVRDTSVVGVLVDRLDDDDEAVRMFAILALERLTGTRLGYDYRAREPLRLRAVAQWRQHLAASQPAATATGGSGS